jgi:hypothetical protein
MAADDPIPPADPTQPPDLPPTADPPTPPTDVPPGVPTPTPDEPGPALPDVPVPPPDTPTPTPPDVPANPPPLATGATIGDLIDSEEAARSARDEAQTAVTMANATLKATSEAADRADDTLSGGLEETGPVYKVKADDVAAIYSSDGASSYHISYAKPVSTPVSAAPPPPAPAPTVPTPPPLT